MMDESADATKRKILHERDRIDVIEYVCERVCSKERSLRGLDPD